MPSASDSETPTTWRRHLWAILGLLVAALLFGAILSLRHILEPEVAAKAPVNTQCDLHQSTCSSELPTGGRVSLSILPHPIPVMQPVQLEVRVEGLNPSDVTVDFTGVNMNMGLNRVRLHPDTGGRYTGNGMLPVCVRERMVWDARVLVTGQNGVIEAPFRFETHRNH